MVKGEKLKVKSGKFEVKGVRDALRYLLYTLHFTLFTNILTRLEQKGVIMITIIRRALFGWNLKPAIAHKTELLGRPRGRPPKMLYTLVNDINVKHLVLAVLALALCLPLVALTMGEAYAAENRFTDDVKVKKSTLSVISGDVTISDGTTNMYTNPGMEQGSITGWSFDNKTDGEAIAYSTDKLSGTYCARIKNSTVGNIAFWQDQSLTSGVTYTMSCYAKDIDCPTTPYFSRAGVTVTTVSGGGSFTGISTTEWKRFTWTFTANATGTLNPYIRTNSNASQGYFLLDDLQFEQASAVTAFVDGTRSAGDVVIDGNLTVNGTFTPSTLGAHSLTGTLTFDGVDLDITTGTNEHLALMPNGTGNVGIGTTAPGRKLDIVSANNVAQLRLTDGGGDSAKDFIVTADPYTTAQKDLMVLFARTNNTSNIISLGGQGTHGAGSINSEGVQGATQIEFYTASAVNTEIINTTSPKMLINASGNVGIGTTSPDRPLHVLSGSTNAIALLEATASSASRLYFKNTGMTSAGDVQIWAQNNDFVINTGGTRQVTILSDGNVGIGTTNPARQLQVYGGSSIVHLRVNTTDADAALSLSTGTSKDWTIGMDDSDSAKLKIQNTETIGTNTHMTLQTDGNVGIGTQSPLAKIHTDGDSWFTDHMDIGSAKTSGSLDTALSVVKPGTGHIFEYTDNNNDNWVVSQSTDRIISMGPETTGTTLQIRTATPVITILPDAGNVGIGTTNPTGGKLHVNSSGSSIMCFSRTGTTPVMGFEIGNDVFGLYDYTNSKFRLRTGGTNGRDLYLAESEGNVGIGTTVPDGKLHVHTATAGSVTPDAVADDLVVENSVHGGISILTPDNQIGTLAFGTPSDAFGAIVRWTHDSDLMTVGTRNAGASLAIETANAAEAVRIDSTGKVGIGTTVPGQKLDVDGNINARTGHKFLLAGNEIAVPSDQDLIGYWAFDDGAGTTAVEGIGQASDGTLPAANWGAGYVGKAGRVDSSYFTAPITASAPLTTTFWFTPTTNTDDVEASANAPLFYWHQDGSNYIAFHIYSYGGAQAGVPYLQPRGYVTAYSHIAGNFLANQWYFAVFKLNTNQMILDIYKDGDIFWTKTSPVDAGFASYNFSELRLYDFGSTNYYDEVRVYDRILNEAEIRALRLYSAAGTKVAKINAQQLGGDITVSGGNVGIGTTAPTFSSGTGLNIYGNPSVVRLTNSGGSGLNNFEIRSALTGSGNRLDIGEGSDTFVTIRSDNDSGATTQRGNVGIGTTSPGKQLEVKSATNTPQLRLRSQDGNTTFDLFANDSTWAELHTSQDRFYLQKELWVNEGKIGSYDEDLQLHTAGTTRITILNSNGSVGIGTTNPDQKLVVTGWIKNTGSGIIHPDGSVTWPSALWGDQVGFFQPASTELALSIGAAEKVRFDSNGNVGIGTASPDAKLFVEGSMKMHNIVSSSPATNHRRLINVAQYSGGSTAHVGTVVVELPVYSHTMQKIKISGWSYLQCWDVVVSGYADGDAGTGKWKNYGNTVVHGNPPFSPSSIRLTSKPDDKFYIFLGNTTTQHGNYVHISVDVESYYSNSLPSTGWDVYITATEPTVTYTDTPTASLYGGNALIAGNVGIGSTAPIEKLDVVGRIAVKDAGNNVIVGYGAGGTPTNNDSNVFIGYNAGGANTSGDNNTFVGYLAGEDLTTGYSNTGVGLHALKDITGGYNNVAIGRQTGQALTTGTGNVFLGYQAGYSETGSNKLYIDNTNTGSPLIYGDFSANTLTINGAATVTGYLTKSGGGFTIDHPLDPENKVLTHSFVESPDMKNLYDGVVVLDENGESTIELPDYFEALNRDFRYSVTPIGSPAMLFIKEEIRDNRFVVAGGEAGMKVSWQVTGTRKDAWAEKNRPKIEEDKGSRDGLVKKGEYIAKDCFEQ